jgi:O-succinylbenzoate synthase
LAAGLALAGALPELEFACGLGTRPLLVADVVSEEDEVRPTDGFLTVLRRAPAPDPALVTEPERADWWRERIGRVRAAGRAPGAGSR